MTSFSNSFQLDNNRNEHNNNNDALSSSMTRIKLRVSQSARRPRVPAFWAESLCQLSSMTHRDGGEIPTPLPRSARLTANSPHLNDLYKSRDGSVCQPARVFVSFHLQVCVSLTTNLLEPFYLALACISPCPVKCVMRGLACRCNVVQCNTRRVKMFRSAEKA